VCINTTASDKSQELVAARKVFNTEGRNFEAYHAAVDKAARDPAIVQAIRDALDLAERGDDDARAYLISQVYFDVLHSAAVDHYDKLFETPLPKTRRRFLDWLHELRETRDAARKRKIDLTWVLLFDDAGLPIWEQDKNLVGQVERGKLPPDADTRKLVKFRDVHWQMHADMVPVQARVYAADILSTERERIDAAIAEEIAEGEYDVALCRYLTCERNSQEMNKQRKEQAAHDRAAGVVRVKRRRRKDVYL
jgi:hypothetical protein